MLDYLYMVVDLVYELLWGVVIKNIVCFEWIGDYINFIVLCFRYIKGINLVWRGISGVVLVVVLDYIDI